MFLFSVRLTRRRVVLSLLAVAIVFGAVFTGVQALRAGRAATVPVSETAAQEKVRPAKIKSAEDRVAFVTSFGWEVEPEPTEVAEVIIPKEFDSVYRQYSELQAAQGFSLEKYAGKRCKRYTYRVLNHPSGEEALCNLLLSGDKVVGGDICSASPDGFLQGLAMQ